jgi:hypothetical protein
MEAEVGSQKLEARDRFLFILVNAQRGFGAQKNDDCI